ncbi:hypothetical protein FEDK69T_05700 [Flavobacterium enshiense DK69]|nr:hypothetical protein FEDK69T_05700 [Flavobacterium enshiense DK69]
MITSNRILQLFFVCIGNFSNQKPEWKILMKFLYFTFYLSRANNKLLTGNRIVNY